MATAAYLKIDNIEGESKRATHENEIEIHDLKWKLEMRPGQRNRGRSRATAQVGALNLRKYIDASSAHLALACMQGKVYREMVLSGESMSDAGSLDYLIITMENVIVSKFDTLGVGEDDESVVIEEELGLTFRKVTYKYTVQNDDHSAGDEHEVSFNS